MVPGIDRLRRSAAGCVIAAAVCLSNAATGQDASPWEGDSRSAVRLIAGSWRQNDATHVLAGVEIRLKPGWHTYWRYPGDAGVPPRFDFTGSRNVKALDVLWPAPRRIREHGLSVIGYASNVILPLGIVPQNHAEPVTLHLNVDYAVCETLCVPQQATAHLVIAAGSRCGIACWPRPVRECQESRWSGKDRRSAYARCGAWTASQGPAHSSTLRLRQAPWSMYSSKGRIRTGRSRCRTPAEEASGGLRRFAFDLDGAPPGGKYDGALITITAVTADDAIEVVAPLH